MSKLFGIIEADQDKGVQSILKKKRRMKIDIFSKQKKKCSAMFANPLENLLN